MQASARWLLALLAVAVLAGMAGAGVWWLTDVRWQWPRADVIPMVALVVAVVAALGGGAGAGLGQR